MDCRRLYFSLNDDAFSLPLEDVQEVIALRGPFGGLDVSGDRVSVRRRTVHLLDGAGIGRPAEHPQKLLIFERNHRLLGLPVRSAATESPVPARELSLNLLVRP